MIVIASANGKVGIQESMRVLKSGGSAINAVGAFPLLTPSILFPTFF